MKIGDTFKAYVPAFDQDIEMQIYSMKDVLAAEATGYIKNVS